MHVLEQLVKQLPGWQHGFARASAGVQNAPATSRRARRSRTVTLREIVFLLLGIAIGALLPRLVRDRADRAPARPSPGVKAATDPPRERGHPDGLPDEVRALVDDGELIHAIKRLREIDGIGLKEAKDAVDRYRSGARG
jgi:hypothetical protein